uniref:Uncharacterized protein n=1 Tax=Oryza sativa subsp. japonica TaxID=39947 RepID=Q6EPV4_ORYSJ|nr:hypothetical protein [Oryza sativa Japonica Group]
MAVVALSFRIPSELERNGKRVRRWKAGMPPLLLLLRRCDDDEKATKKEAMERE